MTNDLHLLLSDVLVSDSTDKMAVLKEQRNLYDQVPSYWWVVASLAETADEQRQALKRLLQLKPDHRQALAILAGLATLPARSIQAISATPSSLPTSIALAPVSEASPAKPIHKILLERAREENNTFVQRIIQIILIFCMVLGVGIGVVFISLLHLILMILSALAQFTMKFLIYRFLFATLQTFNSVNKNPSERHL